MLRINWKEEGLKLNEEFRLTIFDLRRNRQLANNNKQKLCAFAPLREEILSVFASLCLKSKK
ncbi:hypothetical protein LH29_04690 [Draconibacterium sediminis]|uniref:Uncharacterized protein n=1 Tax=Draconibacterium sediminis TaxID=1544798 RepID=A0A0D8JDI9_9BACT|nr:hypothetical protein LH29_04690 [Draconibacterium sediminis]